MHELILASDILQIVQASAAREHFRRVATLRLEAGALAGVEVPALRFALEALQPGTCLDGAEIQIDEPPGRAWCASCAAEVEIENRIDPCPRCSGYPVRPTGGLRLRVIELLVRND